MVVTFPTSQSVLLTDSGVLQFTAWSHTMVVRGRW